MTVALNFTSDMICRRMLKDVLQLGVRGNCRISILIGMTGRISPVSCRGNKAKPLKTLTLYSVALSALIRMKNPLLL